MTHTITKSHTHVALATLTLMGMLTVASFASAHGDEVKTTSTADATCMQTAAETREGSLITAWDEFNTSIHNALDTRKDALSDAWGESDKKAQKKANIAAWKEWKKASKDAHAELKKDRKAAWDTFKTTAKSTCKVTTPKEEALEKDAAGTIGL